MNHPALWLSLVFLAMAGLIWCLLDEPDDDPVMTPRTSENRRAGAHPVVVGESPLALMEKAEMLQGAPEPPPDSFFEVGQIKLGEGAPVREVGAVAGPQAEPPPPIIPDEMVTGTKGGMSRQSAKSVGKITPDEDPRELSPVEKEARGFRVAEMERRNAFVPYVPERFYADRTVWTVELTKLGVVTWSYHVLQVGPHSFRVNAYFMFENGKNFSYSATTQNVYPPAPQLVKDWLAKHEEHLERKD